jgi:hypothetical protein
MLFISIILLLRIGVILHNFRSDCSKDTTLNPRAGVPSCEAGVGAYIKQRFGTWGASL